MFQALLDTCCDRPGLLSSCTKGKFTLDKKFEAILVVPELIARSVLYGWRDWEPGGQSEVMLQMFQALLILLRDDHPYREFNAAQLNRVHFVNSLFQFCKVSV